jgi:hypothetical protein
MREETLKRFFLGEVSGSELAQDVAGSRKKLSSVVSRIAMEDMDTEFVIRRPMLISLCDAVLEGSLPPDALAVIGFALEASDKFEWDSDEDDLVAEVIADWSCPEINYPLTIDNVRRFKGWLTGTESYPARPSAVTSSDGRIISMVEKKSIERHRQSKHRK